jgi:hypothetical protein
VVNAGLLVDFHAAAVLRTKMIDYYCISWVIGVRCISKTQAKERTAEGEGQELVAAEGGVQ